MYGFQVVRIITPNVGRIGEEAEFEKLKFELMMNKETLLKIFEKYKNASTGGIYMTKWDAMADEILSSQNAAKSLVSGSLPSDERIFFADYIQRCVIDRGAMTYPSLKDAITAWDETKDRFGGNDR